MSLAVVVVVVMGGAITHLFCTRYFSRRTSEWSNPPKGVSINPRLCQAVAASKMVTKDASRRRVRRLHIWSLGLAALRSPPQRANVEVSVSMDARRCRESNSFPIMLVSIRRRGLQYEVCAFERPLYAGEEDFETDPRRSLSDMLPNSSAFSCV